NAGLKYSNGLRGALRAGREVIEDVTTTRSHRGRSRTYRREFPLGDDQPVQRFGETDALTRRESHRGRLKLQLVSVRAGVLTPKLDGVVELLLSERSGRDGLTMRKLTHRLGQPLLLNAQA